MSIKKFHILVFCQKDLSSKAVVSDRRNWNLKNSMSLPVSVRFSCEIRLRLMVVKNSSNQFDFAIKRNTSTCLCIWDQTSYCLGWERMKSYSRNTCPLIQEILVHLFKKYLSTYLRNICPPVYLHIARWSPFLSNAIPNKHLSKITKKIFSLFFSEFVKV